jgi:hypothetical protein
MQDKILGNTSDPVVAGLPHEHLLALWRRLALMPGLELHREDDLLRWQTGIPDGFFMKLDNIAALLIPMAFWRTPVVALMH